MSDDTLIINEGRDWKYYTVIPNMIDDLGMSVYSFRLYCHLRRVTGENGKSWQSTRTLATYCSMSVKSVVQAKKELEKNKLIRITTEKGKHGGRDYHLITIVDIWKRNTFQYSQEQVTTGNLQDSTGNEQVTEGERKNIPPKNAMQPKKKNGAAASADTSRSEFSSENSSLPRKSADSTLQNENIRMMKRVWGFSPHKIIRPSLIDLFAQFLGPDGLLDETKLKTDLVNWVARGWNPTNYTLFFKNYFEDFHYMNPDDKMSTLAENHQ